MQRLTHRLAGTRLIEGAVGETLHDSSGRTTFSTPSLFISQGPDPLDIRTR